VRPPRPAWFESATKAVLAGAGSLDAADGPRELEQRTAELLGAELHRVLQEGHAGLAFAEWFDDVVVEAAGAGTAMLRLLTGMTAIATSALAPTACVRVRTLLADADRPPDWFDDLSSVPATGEVFLMRDAYGTRFAVLAGFTYGHGREPSVFLFDIDASGIVTLAGAGVFDDVDRRPPPGCPRAVTPPATPCRNRSRTRATCCAWCTGTSMARPSWATSRAS
jgi:hypothetical protein